MENDLRDEDIEPSRYESMSRELIFIVGGILIFLLVGFLTYSYVEQVTLFVEINANNEISNLRLSDEEVTYLISRESQQYNLEMASFNQLRIDFLDERQRVINSTTIPLEQLRIGEYPIKIDVIPEDSVYVSVSIIRGEEIEDTQRIRISTSLVES